MIELIKTGQVSIFKFADMYPDKDKFWQLMGMIELIDLPMRVEQLK